MVIKVAGHEYCVTNKPKRHSKSHSLGSISDFDIEIEKTKIDKSFYCSNNNSEGVECKNNQPLSADSCNTGSDSEPKEICQPKTESREVKTNGYSGDSDDNVKINQTVTEINQNHKNNNRTASPEKSERISALNKSNKTQGTSDAVKNTVQSHYGLSKSKSEGNPFHHKKRGRIIKIERPNIRGKISMVCRVKRLLSFKYLKY